MKVNKVNKKNSQNLEREQYIIFNIYCVFDACGINNEENNKM